MRLLGWTVLLLVVTACRKDDSFSGSGSPPAAVYLDQPYGADSLQKMDIYLPAGRTLERTKVIILIHGGAWIQGDKSDFSEYVDTLKRRLPDYAIFNVNYRLATGTSDFFPAQEQDIQAAVSYIAQHFSSYQVSGKVVLLGASAGGHLALLQGYKHPSPVLPAAIIDFFGPTDLADMYNHPLNPLIPPVIASVMGGTPDQLPDLYAASSPLNFITPQSAPTLILQGGQDPLVAPSQSESLQAKLQAAGVANQYVFYPAEGHGWTGPDLTDSFNRIDSFLTARVK
ncbi:MAG TPA: alpha/beta hydrolase [Chitinophagaceae bacterium]|nr:alpha/beta hydrolase [Chitinophagaceae bacterium]